MDTVAMVGDRLSTDIYGAKPPGFVQYWSCPASRLAKRRPPALVQPDYIFSDITELASFPDAGAVSCPTLSTPLFTT